MKYFYLLIFSLIVISCKNDTEIKGKEYNPINKIAQTIKNPLSKKYFDKAKTFNRKQYDSIDFYLKRSLSYEKNPIIFNQFGINEMGNNDLEKAIVFYKKGIEIDSTYFPNYINMSRSYLMMNQYGNSEIILNKLLKNSNSDYWTANANMYLALVYFNGYKDCKRALKTLEKAKILKFDADLGNQYLDFEGNLRYSCN